MSGSIINQLQQVPANRTSLRRQDFDTSVGTANQRTKIAEYQAETPMFLRPEAAMRLAFATVEQFQTPGDGSQTSYNLSNNIIETPNTDNIALYEAGQPVRPDSVDYQGDSFTYTGSGSTEYLHAFYVPRDPTRIEIERQAPRSQGGVEDVVFDATTSLLHERNQHKEPLYPDGNHPLDLIVPKKWKLQVYAQGPVQMAYTDEETANPQGTHASNALLEVPVRKAQSNVRGLSQAVKTRIIDPRT